MFIDIELSDELLQNIGKFSVPVVNVSRLNWFRNFSTTDLWRIITGQIVLSVFATHYLNWEHTNKMRVRCIRKITTTTHTDLISIPTKQTHISYYIRQDKLNDQRNNKAWDDWRKNGSCGSQLQKNLWLFNSHSKASALVWPQYRTDSLFCLCRTLLESRVHKQNASEMQTWDGQKLPHARPHFGNIGFR